MKLIRLILCTLLLAPVLMPLSAQQKSRKVSRLEQQRHTMLRKIEATSKELQQIKKNSREEAKRLTLVRQQVQQRQQVIAVIGQELDALKEQLDSLDLAIGQLRLREERLHEQYAESLRALQRSEAGRRQLIFILSARSITEAHMRSLFLSRYARSASKLATELRSTRQGIEMAQQEVAALHKQKATVLAIRDKERKALEQEESRRTTEIKNLKGQEATLAKNLAKQRRQAAQLEAQIEAQIAAEIAASERRNKRPTKSKGGQGQPAQTQPGSEPERKPAISGGYAMDASERKLSGSFAENKGRLPMPVRGRYELTRRFGTQQHSEHSRISIVSGGIDLRVYSDRQAYAVFEGVVSRVFVAPGYGQSVIIRHGNYLTVYANLSSVRVNTGQKVSSGVVIGVINTDSDDSGGSTLHFQLWHERTKQNPESWVAKR